MFHFSFTMYRLLFVLCLAYLCAGSPSLSMLGVKVALGQRILARLAAEHRNHSSLTTTAESSAESSTLSPTYNGSTKINGTTNEWSGRPRNHTSIWELFRLVSTSTNTTEPSNNGRTNTMSCTWSAAAWNFTIALAAKMQNKITTFLNLWT